MIRIKNASAQGQFKNTGAQGEIFKYYTRSFREQT